MRIHKEGYVSILITIVVIIIINLITHLWFNDYLLLKWMGYALSLFLLVMILQFFRNPIREVDLNDKYVLSPADGKIVVIEETNENEYFKDKRIQVSVFMSPINVHVNRYPVSGEVKYAKYHPGLYLVAWHPKSSTENERTTIVVERKDGIAVLFRQIAGALARRIVFYCKEGDKAVQGNEMGFIKFGSRVDVFLPLNAQVKVKIGETVVGAKTVLANLN